MKNLYKLLALFAAALLLSACFTADDDDPNADFDFGGGSDESDVEEDLDDAEDGEEDTEDDEDVDDGQQTGPSGMTLQGSLGAGAQGFSSGAGFGLVGAFSPMGAPITMTGSGFQLVAAPPVLTGEVEAEAAE